MNSVLKFESFNEDELIQSKSYPDEIEPTIINLSHAGVTTELTDNHIYFKVSGTIFSIETNTELNFEKEFISIEGANSYYDDIIKRFPLSTVIIKKIETTDIKIYG